ncbi:DUF3943 domain-containing protein [Treponema zioleckii]|uniref:DUF3943 domain-containing protein n=1 Tax=Treponema zioleckii TaxID=331680 RepID=UPI00168B94D9|nr:DUF3943 domain-containing protein [Treponema zioleckii]
MLLLILAGNIFAQTGADSDSDEEKFSAKDIVIATGDVFLINMVFNSSARIFLKEDYSQIDIDTMKTNLHRNWCWDKDGFFMNQFGHPYQGSLYFNAARSNGLNFWQSFLVTAGGSLMWEEFGETTTPAVNDFITTPLCGSLVGETLHRLYIDANEIFPPLAWLISPLDAINSMCKGKEIRASGRTEELDIIFHGDFDNSNVDYCGSDDSDKINKNAGGIAFHIQYGKLEGHTTKENYDSFTADLELKISSHYYDIVYCIDGFLYSRALYFEESEGTIGLNLMYEGEKSNIIAFSNAALGLKYFGYEKIYDFAKFRYFAQIDGIFLGTRSLYRLFQNIRINTNKEDKLNPVRSYNFGGGALFKAGFSLETENFGRLYGEGEVNFLVPYIYAKLEESEANKHFIAQVKLGYEYELTEHFTLGIRDSFVYKKDWFENEPNTVHLLNSAQIYGKLVFKRK